MDWRTAVGKALLESEREFLYDSAARTAAKFGSPVLVNIGVFRCASMYCLRAGAPRARLVGIDVVACATPVDSQLRAEFIIADSTKCYVKFHEPIHLLFIDGNHHFEYVLADLNNWSPKVVSQGRVILHDCYPKPKDLQKTPHLEGVNRAVNTWFPGLRTQWSEVIAPGSLRAFDRL